MEADEAGARPRNVSYSKKVDDNKAYQCVIVTINK